MQSGPPKNKVKLFKRAQGRDDRSCVAAIALLCDEPNEAMGRARFGSKEARGARHSPEKQLSCKLRHEETTLVQSTHTSLRAKLMRTMLLCLIAVGLLSTGATAWMRYKSSQGNLIAMETQITSRLTDKGRLLVENHGLALKGLVEDNAFSDVEKLVKQTIKGDRDVVYGMFYSMDDEKPWSYVAPGTEGMKPKEALAKWPELGLVPEKVDHRKTSQRDVALFGEEIFEFTFPVVVDEEVLGTISYGISTRVMHDTITAARTKNEKEFKTATAYLGGIGLLGVVFGLLMMRRESQRITSPLTTLTGAARKISEGKRDIRVNIQSGDELEILGSSFNEMLGDLENSYRELEDLNAGLEEKVAARTAQLASRNRDMRIVFDNVEQGFITVNRDGVMADERSAVVSTWFGASSPGDTFAEYMSRVNDDIALNFEIGWGSLVGGFLPVELCMEQMPKRGTVGGRHFEFAYIMVGDGEPEDFESVLIIITDITEQLAREQAESEQQEILELFARVSKDRGGFLSFYKEMNRLIDDTCKRAEEMDLAHLKRALHTIKGNAGVYGLAVVAKICHRLEDGILENNRAPSPEELSALRTRWTELQKTVSMLIGGDQGDVIEITEDDYRSLLSAVWRGTPKEELARAVVNLKLEPIGRAFDRIGDQAYKTAEALGREGFCFKYEAGDVRLDAEHWAGFWSDFVHVMRNAIDHGLETPHERKTTGKTEPPILTMSARYAGDKFVLECRDNGRGIDWSRVAAKADALGLAYKTQEELKMLLFADEFSTREEVSEFSGRGVGLAATRSATLDREGQIEIESVWGQGSTFRFTFPLSQAHGVSSEAKAQRASPEALPGIA